MIQVVDRALADLLRRDLLGDAVPVSLDAPNRPWSAGITRPTVNVFLFDVRENLARREVMHEPVRDANGTVRARRPPPTRYDLFYVASVWGCPTELEHQLLSALVACLGSYDVLPAELLGDAGGRHAYHLSTAGGMKRGMLPMFGGELKMQVDLAVTAPVSAVLDGVAGPPVREAARLRVLAAAPDQIAAVRGRGPSVPAARVGDADPFRPAREAIAAAVAALPPPPAAAASSPGKQPAGPRPAGAPGQPRPAGAPEQPRPAGAPAQPRPAAGPGQPRAGGAVGTAGAPHPLVLLRAALTQAAQAQAALAQAAASLASLVPAPAATPAAAKPSAGTDKPAG